MKTVTFMDGSIHKLSDVEAIRYEKYRAKVEVIDERKLPRHPNRQLNSREAMRNMMRFRNKKRYGNYAGIW